MQPVVPFRVQLKVPVKKHFLSKAYFNACALKSELVQYRKALGVRQLAAAFVTSQRRRQAAALQGRSELNNVTGTFNCTTWDAVMASAAQL